jgi:hypothetical protein
MRKEKGEVELQYVMRVKQGSGNHKGRRRKIWVESCRVKIPGK